MVELTVQVPEEVAARLEPVLQNLPALLQQIAFSVPTDTVPDRVEADEGAATPVYQEILNFLAIGPASQAIWEFKASAAAQERLQQLLEKNREATLSSTEQAELDAYEQVDYLMTLLKARAYHQLNIPDQGIPV
ncbi:MAG: hypothetical protein KJ063_11725 [Anaerolineae bacterium]|nr:hypothetical protein [Anaerolineae bacterium]